MGILKTKLILFAIIILPAWSASASESIRVLVADNQNTVTVKSEAGLIVDGDFSQRAGKRITVTEKSVGAYPKRIESEGEFIQVNGKSYRGSMEFRRKQNGRLQVINELHVEDYLIGVIASEVPHDWELEVLKAQAIASRTYAIYQIRTAGNRPYHVFASVDSQVYNGKGGEREAGTRAVRLTEGVVLTYRGDVIPAFYHSSCGGHTENASMLWGIDKPFLKGVACECQEISRYGVWEKRFNRMWFAKALSNKGYPMSDVQDIRIEGITPAGRVKNIAVEHAGTIVTIPAERFRAAIGYSAVPSIFFEVELSGDEVVLSGRGLGHGVGLCQWGAKEMAQRGHDHRSILAHYYPGTQVEKRRDIRP